MKNNKKEEFEVFYEESELVWRTRTEMATLDLQDVKLIKTVHKYMLKAAVLPIVLPVVIAVSLFPKPVVADPRITRPTPIVKVDSYKKEKISSKTEKISSPSFQKGEKFIDSITGETFEVLFYSKDYRAPKNNIKIQVIKIPWSHGGLLYNGLIYLQQANDTFEQNKRILDLVFKENIKEGITTFQVKQSPLKGRLLGGQEQHQEAAPIIVEPKVTKKINSSLLMLAGTVVLVSGGVALGCFYIKQRKDILSLEKALGLVVKKGTYSAKALKLYENVFYPRCEKPIYPVNQELCKSLANLEVLNQLIMDQIKNLAELSRPGFLDILKGFEKEERKQLKELYKEFGF
jgi:hypothetical protein